MEKYIYTHTLLVYTLVGRDGDYYLLENEDGVVIHVQDFFFECRYFPYSEEKLEELKRNRMFHGQNIKEKDTSCITIDE